MSRQKELFDEVCNLVGEGDPESKGDFLQCTIDGAHKESILEYDVRADIVTFTGIDSGGYSTHDVYGKIEKIDENFGVNDDRVQLKFESGAEVM